MHPEEKEIYKSILIACICIGSIIFYFIFSIIRNNRKWKNELKQLMYREINNIEQQRNNIAKNLHDSIGPELAALKFMIDDIEPSTIEEEATQKSIKSEIDKIIGDTRTISHELTPKGLIKNGLLASVEQYAAKLQNASLKILILNEGYIPLAYDKELQLYRILEEIILNTIKYADATWLKIMFQSNKDHMMLITRDNGIGFDVKSFEKEPEKGGIGLQNIKFRAELIGGEFDIHSEANKGVEIKITLQL